MRLTLPKRTVRTDPRDVKSWPFDATVASFFIRNTYVSDFEITRRTRFCPLVAGKAILYNVIISLHEQHTHTQNTKILRRTMF